MKTPLRLLTLFFVLFWVVSAASGQGIATTSPEEVGFSAERLARIDAHLEACIEEGCLPGMVALVARHGKTAYFKSFGMVDPEAGTPLRTDAIFRLASMTKPVVSVAVMILCEEGRLLLSDPVSKYIPEFEDPQVLVELNAEDTTYTTEPARREITVRDLLTHTSGIGYGIFHEQLGPIYQKADVPAAWEGRDVTIGEKMRVLAGLPLAHHPGEAWTYGLNTDVLGYLVEVVSGMPLDRFLEARIFMPLGMQDTYFYLPPEKADRLTPLYGEIDGTLKRYDQDPEARAQAFPSHTSPNYPVEGARTYFSGGAGLSSTASDYARFAQMLLGGGALDDVRILSPKTVELMTANHIGSLPFLPGYGFGLGFRVLTDLGGAGELGSEGMYGWDGYWNTRFWIDPKEDLIGIFLSQANPSSYSKDQFQGLVYQAIVETEPAVLPSSSRR